MKSTLLASLFGSIVLLGAFAACGGEEPAPQPPPPPPPSAAPEAPQPPPTASAPAPSAQPAPAPPPPPKPVVTLKDFQTPESVFYDAKDDVYLVSNINGSPNAADNNGFISRAAPDGSKVELKWIEAGKKGVKLDAPKGMAIVGTTLYIADITRVRMFDAASGKPKGEVPLAGATFANDIVAGPDGKVYVSDSGIKIDEKGPQPTKSDAVYAIDKGKAKVIAKGEDLGHPNGLLWANDKLWVVTFGSGEIYSLDKDGKKADAQKLPKGALDGIVPDGDAFLVSSWEAPGVFKGKPGGNWDLVLPGLTAPADIGFDTKRNLVLVPRMQDNIVEAFAAP